MLGPYQKRWSPYLLKIAMLLQPFNDSETDRIGSDAINGAKSVVDYAIKSTTHLFQNDLGETEQQRKQRKVKEYIARRDGQVTHSDDPALVVSDRKDHCRVLADIIGEHGIKVAVLTGDLAKGKRQRIIEDLHTGQVDVLFSTVQLIGEGFDCKRLSALFLATPIKASSRLQQVVGRVLRADAGKNIPKVYDYVDAHGVLKSSFRSRMETFQKTGVLIPN